MMTRSRSRKLKRTGFALASVPLAATMLVSAPVVVAQDEGGAATLEEIIVTATKRAENLQDVPASIVAIGTEQLEQLHVQDFTDYVKMLPSVSYENLGPGFARVYMRGVVSGDNGNHSGPLPSVGMYLDEQPITTITGALDLHIYDIARVEALAGPQGTLYGASSEAGTVRIITNKPDTSGFKAGYSLEGNTMSHGGMGGVAEAFVNMPLGSRAAVRLVGWVEHDGGYIDNVYGTRTYVCPAGVSVCDDAAAAGNPVPPITINNAAVAKNDYNPVDVVGGRAALKVELNDSWTVTPGVIYQRTDTKGLFAFDPNVGDLAVTHFFPEKSTDAFTQASLTIEGRIANLDLVYAGALLNRNDEVLSDYTDYSFFYDQCCGYGVYAFDNNGNYIAPSQHIIGKDHYTKQSHELRVSTSKDNRVRFVGGLFMQRQLHGIEQRYMIDGLTSDYWVTGWPDTLWLTEQERIDRDYAAFGELTFDVTDKLTATGGLRYFKAKNSIKGFFGFSQGFSSGTGEAACFDPPDPTPGGGLNGGPCNNLDQSVDQTGSTPKVNLTYHIDNDRMVYATYSKGFRPGGINRRGDFPPYKPDYLTNYEAGWKTSWADNRLRFNGAVFFESWKDFQFSYLGANGLTNITNAGKAEITGLEASIEWAVTRDLMVYGGLTVLDPKLAEPFCKDITLTADECATSAPDLYAPKGTVLPVTPKFKGNVTARYLYPVGSFDGNLQGTYVYQGSSRSALLPSESAILGEQGAFGTLDLSAGLARGGFSYELYITNVFDERAAVGRYAECDSSVCGAQSYFVPNEPRMIGLRLSQSF
jgi:iron complex outermembrane recepter protein